MASLALAAAAGAGGCLFAPDRCVDLLQCGKGGNGGSGGGGGSGAGGATSGGGFGPTSSTGIPFTPCTTDDQCTTLSCVAGVCKAATGAPCSVNGDCFGGECRFGLCRANIGHACTIAAECFNCVCKMNTCQACFDDVDCPGTACGIGGKQTDRRSGTPSGRGG